MHSKNLIITGDDFGRSSQINEEIERYHRAGLLTQASLMVNEPSAEEAVRIARRNPALTVGLHLTLCCGAASRVSALTDSQGRLPSHPATAGLSYAFRSGLRSALKREITAQFEKFCAWQLPPTYWDGHTHLHLHPTLLRLTLPIAKSHGFTATRLVRERGWHILQIIFRQLSAAAQPKLEANSIRFANHAHGLMHTGCVDTYRFERYLLSLEPGWSEIYFHPGAEIRQLDCGVLKELIALEGIRLASSMRLPSPPDRAKSRT